MGLCECFLRKTRLNHEYKISESIEDIREIIKSKEYENNLMGLVVKNSSIMEKAFEDVFGGIDIILTYNSELSEAFSKWNFPSKNMMEIKKLKLKSFIK